MPIKKTKSTTSAKSAASGNNRVRAATAKKPGQPPSKPAVRLTPEQLATIHHMLLSAAKTPDQHADAAVVRAAVEQAQQGNHSTAQSLMAKVGAWAQKIAPTLKQHVEIAVAQEIRRLL